MLVGLWMGELTRLHLVPILDRATSAANVDRSALSASARLPTSSQGSVNLIADVEDGLLDSAVEKSSKTLQTFEAVAAFAALPIAVITGKAWRCYPTGLRASDRGLRARFAVCPWPRRP